MSKTVLSFDHVSRHFLKPPGAHRVLLGDEEPNEETVRAKWAELQAYESRVGKHDNRQLFDIPFEDISRVPSDVAGPTTGAKSKWKQMKKDSMKKLSNLTSLLHISKRSSPSPSVPKSDAVSTAPDGRKSSGVLPRIYASKSMQNLENITRGGYHNIRDATANLKEKCNSIAELRQGQSQYVELPEEGRPTHQERRTALILQKMGLN